MTSEDTLFRGGGMSHVIGMRILGDGVPQSSKSRREL